MVSSTATSNWAYGFETDSQDETATRSDAFRPESSPRQRYQTERRHRRTRSPRPGLRARTLQSKRLSRRCGRKVPGRRLRPATRD